VQAAAAVGVEALHLWGATRGGLGGNELGWGSAAEVVQLVCDLSRCESLAVVREFW